MAGNQQRLRKPGEAFELSDEELLAAPPRMLSTEQRRRRRLLKNNTAKKKTRQRRAEHRARGEVKVKYCQADKARGGQCTGYAVIGAKHCFMHLTEEERRDLNIVKPKRSDDERAMPSRNVIQLMREVTETTGTKLLEPYLKANGLELLGFDEEGHAVVRSLGENAGLMLYGESKDGEIIMTNHQDLAGRVQITEKLFDRVYGKPRQTQVLEGGSKPIQVQPVRSVERSHQMASLLGQLGLARPLDLPGGPEPLPDVEATAKETSEVVQLRPPNER